jgi:sugar phosphate isomerase/epimerase
VEICNNNNEETLNCHANMVDYIANVREAGLFFSSVGRWNSNMNAGGHVNEEEFAIVSKTLEDAITAGAPTFVCGCNYDDSVSLFRNYSAAIEIFGRLAEKAKGTGTSVAIYNCDWNNFVHDIDAWKIVLGELPDVKIKFDASHSYHAGRDYMHEIADWADRFSHVHVKGAVVNRGRYIDDPPAGMDDLKWGSIFAGLLISIFQCGSNYMSSNLGVAKEISDLITGILLMFSACGGYFQYVAQRRVSRERDLLKAAEKAKEGEQ